MTVFLIFGLTALLLVFRREVHDLGKQTSLKTLFGCPFADVGLTQVAEMRKSGEKEEPFLSERIELRPTIEKQIQTEKVLVYSKTSCPHSLKAKEFL